MKYILFLLFGDIKKWEESPILSRFDERENQHAYQVLACHVRFSPDALSCPSKALKAF